MHHLHKMDYFLKIEFREFLFQSIIILNLETESIVFSHYLSCENLSHTMCQTLRSIDGVFKYTDYIKGDRQGPGAPGGPSTSLGPLRKLAGPLQVQAHPSLGSLRQ